MSRPSNTQPKAIPAQVDFLAIYNPELGTTDATLSDQIVYYWAPKDAKKKTKSKTFSDREEENERLRHVGLAQGMIEFAKTFSDGRPVETVETEKSRIVLHEIEEGWWILAPINLTRLPKATNPSAAKGVTPENDDAYEYSSREVKCSDLLVQELRRAHSGFLFHHGTTLRQLYSQNIKSKFASLLRRYWDDYLSTWNVMLHGNPAVSIYGGTKLAGSRELGIGVGEEDRGSGEREVLEGFVGRIGGLVDLVVSRFGDAKANIDDEKGSKQTAPLKDGPQQPWIGSGADPSHDDGAIFLGVGALSKDSIQDITRWMEDIYCWGPQAYGIMNDPNHSSRRKNAERSTTRSSVRSGDGEASSHKTDCSPQVSLKKASPKRVKRSENVVELHQNGKFHLKPVSPHPATPDTPEPEGSAASDQNPDEATKKRSDSVSAVESSGQTTYMDYFKLGYGKHWSLGGVTGASSKNKEADSSDAPKLAPSPAFTIPRPLVPPPKEPPKPKEPNVYYPSDDSIGHYLVGLLGDLDEPEDPQDSGNDGGSKVTKPIVTTRIVTVGISAADGGQAKPAPEKLCIVLYCNRPFMYALLFKPETKALYTTSLYRALHYQLSPLQRPLLSSTSHRFRQRSISTTTAVDTRSPIYNLVWDPKQQLISSTVPNIPSPHHGHENYSKWTRLEALNTHTQILNTFAATRGDAAELERTCKTSRNHWIVWTRLPDPESKELIHPDSRSGSATPTDSDTRPSTATSKMSHGRRRSTSVSRTADKEIWLVRKAGDGNGRGDEKQGLARGIGVDTRLYIDELLRSLQ